MPDFVKLAATAKRLIEKSGRAVTIYRSNREAADPAKPWRGPDVSGPPTAGEGGGRIAGVRAAFVPVGTAKDREPTLLRDVDHFVLVAATSLPAGTDLSGYDALLDGTRIYKIHYVGRLKPGTVDMLWKLGIGA